MEKTSDNVPLDIDKLAELVAYKIKSCQQVEEEEDEEEVKRRIEAYEYYQLQESRRMKFWCIFFFPLVLAMILVGQFAINALFLYMFAESFQFEVPCSYAEHTEPGKCNLNISLHYLGNYAHLMNQTCPEVEKACCFGEGVFTTNCESTLSHGILRVFMLGCLPFIALQNMYVPVFIWLLVRKISRIKS